MTIGYSYTSRIITMHYFYFIIYPLYQHLVQSRRNTFICMNPITTKDKTEVTLCLSDEESRGERLTSNSKLYGDYTFSPHWLASSNPTDGNVGLDELLI
jgi:predicted ABC-type exoprotein transport system permease subunit